MRVRFAQRYLCILFICALSAFTYICLKPESQISVFLFLPISVIGFCILIFGFTIMGSASKKRAQLRANHATGNAAPLDNATALTTVSVPLSTEPTFISATQTPVFEKTTTQTASSPTGTSTASPEPSLPSTSSSATGYTFREFIEIANSDTVRQFIKTAVFLPDAENLELLWNRAFRDGYLNGRVEFYSTGLERGFKKGYKEGL